MIRNALFASAITLAALGTAQAQDAGPRLVGGGADATVAYAAPSPNRAGGGLAAITGGAQDQSLSYASGATQRPSGLVGEVVGGGENRQLVYRPLPAATRLVAGAGARQGG
ncbi:hypothetical protein [Paracraurococcus ruber]|uniref:Uncharacterized protein n=1 Tax=Paracraurococcus ruber TaxID=77675 RepID=A0ABS1CYR6_9PROT|nr:hypothetical protein [Paracraurococcus ruber]MBK1659678.1 hypothetical protein [Paracraurococcus ruber]TDG29207.1 hypothetical protein E2C05_18615 [Paracraurococcus ruber]